MMEYKKIFITGGAGFIGSNLVRALLTKDLNVLVYDNFFTGKTYYLPESRNLTVVKGDILNRKTLFNTIKQFEPDVAFHLAALHFIPFCRKFPQKTIEVNIIGTQSVLEALAQCKLQKFIFVSTAAIYKRTSGFISEETEEGPDDIYGLTKHTNEMQVALYSKENRDVRCIIARLFNVYGPNETNPHLIPEILSQVKNKASDIRLGNIESKRDYIFVDDVISAFLALLFLRKKFAIYNIGTGVEYSARELVSVVNHIFGKRFKIKINKRKKRNIDKLHLLSDISKIKRDTGWKPDYQIEDGLRKILCL